MATKGETIPHEFHLRKFILAVVQTTRAAKTDAVIASPTADAAALKVAVDQIRVALTTSGVTK